MKHLKTAYIITCALIGVALTFLWIKDANFVYLISLILAFSILSYKKPLIGLYLILFLPVLGEFSRLEFLGKSIIISDLIIPLFIVTFLLRQNSTKLINSSIGSIKILLAFLGFAAFSLLLSLMNLSVGEVFNSSLYLIRLIEYIALFPITIHLIQSQADLDKTIKIIAIISLLIAITGFIQLQILPSLEELAKNQGYDPHINRLVGSWLDPNFIGGFFAFIFCLFTGFLLYQKDNKQRLLNMLFLFIIASALFLTYSRSAYLALAMGILTLGLLKSRQLIIAIIILGCIGLTISDRAQERVNQLVTSINSVVFNTSENPDPTARLRLQNWEQTLTLISEKPVFGHGYNTLTYAKLNHGFVEDQNIHSASGSDSSLLTILATTGFTGLIFYLFFLVKTLFYTFQKWRSSNQPYQKGLYLGLFSALISLIIHSNFVNSLLFPQIMIFLWISLGLIYSRPNN